MKRFSAFSVVAAVLMISASAQGRIYDTVWSAAGPPTTNLSGSPLLGSYLDTTWVMA